MTHPPLYASVSSVHYLHSLILHLSFRLWQTSIKLHCRTQLVRYRFAQQTLWKHTSLAKCCRLGLGSGVVLIVTFHLNQLSAFPLDIVATAGFRQHVELGQSAAVVGVFE